MLTEHLAALACGRCLGTLVSLVSYRAWREGAGSGALPPMPEAVADVDAPDSVGAKKCPKCRSLMSKYRISVEKTNRLDYCPHCDEVWLDDGEWQLVEGLALSGDFSRVFTQAWQNRVISGITGAMETGRLRSLLGEDATRVEALREWIQTHPQRLAILARLSRAK